MKDELRDNRIDGVAGDPIRIQMDMGETAIEQSSAPISLLHNPRYLLIGVAVVAITAFMLGLSIGRNNPPSGVTPEKLIEINHRMETMDQANKNLTAHNQALRQQMEKWERQYESSIDNLAKDVREIKEYLAKWPLE